MVRTGRATRALTNAPARRASRSLRPWISSSCSFLTRAASCWSRCSPSCRMRWTNSAGSMSSAAMAAGTQATRCCEARRRTGLRLLGGGGTPVTASTREGVFQ